MELPPELQDIKDRLITNYANGGLPAVQRMVADLEVEAESAKTFADIGRQIEDETIATQDTIGDDELRSASELAQATTSDSIKGTTRHSFALFLLGVISDIDS